MNATVLGDKVLQYELRPPQYGQPWTLRLIIGARFKVIHLRSARDRQEAELKAAAEIENLKSTHH